MQSCTLPPALATLRAVVAAASDRHLPPSPDLLAAFASVPNPRRRQGTRFPLAALLTLAVAALLSNHLSVLAITEWAADPTPDRLDALGLTDGRSPHQSTLQRLFRKRDPAALSTARTSCFAAAAPPPPRGSQGVACDGKAQRGRLRFPHSGTPVHALSAVAHGSGVVLAQLPIPSWPTTTRRKPN